MSDENKQGEVYRRLIAPKVEVLLAAQKDPNRNWRELLDDRQKKEVQFAEMYGNQFAHGTTGHNQLMLIFELACLMDFIFNNFELVEKD